MTVFHATYIYLGIFETANIFFYAQAPKKSLRKFFIQPKTRVKSGILFQRETAPGEIHRDLAPGACEQAVSSLQEGQHIMAQQSGV